MDTFLSLLLLSIFFLYDNIHLASEIRLLTSSVQPMTPPNNNKFRKKIIFLSFYFNIIHNNLIHTLLFIETCSKFSDCFNCTTYIDAYVNCFWSKGACVSIGFDQ